MKKMEVKMDVAVREVIKPASPSPRDHLQLSIIDLTSPGMYVSMIYFYKPEDLVTASAEIFSKNMKDSLSNTLSRFYPLAGRIEGTSISCNDEGAVYTETRTDLLLPDLLRNINTYSLQGFHPTLAPGDSASEWPLLSAKVTFLGSGSGVAVSVSVSHKICDAASMVTFVKDWATTTTKGKSSGVVVNTIEFAETTIYPPPPHTFVQPQLTDYNFNNGRKCVTERLVFKPSKIAELKHKAASESVLAPTRVEAISSLIWRCARNVKRSNLVVPRSTRMFQAMDLRLRIPTTVLPRDAIGNLQTVFFLNNDAEDELEIPNTVAAFRKAKEGVNEMIKENTQGNTIGHILLSFMKDSMSDSSDIDNYVITSWCRKPFYEVDFGWGGPVWIGFESHTIYDTMEGIMLVDSKDGDGVEAWINFPEKDMSVLVRDQELLAYAVLNPPVLI